jgi:hypothetical protein
MKYPIVIEKEVWMDSQLSIARFYGSITINGTTWFVMPESYDLVCQDWVLVYVNLGREKTIELLKNDTPLREAKKLLKERQKK